MILSCVYPTHLLNSSSAASNSLLLGVLVGSGCVGCGFSTGVSGGWGVVAGVSSASVSGVAGSTCCTRGDAEGGGWGPPTVKRANDKHSDTVLPNASSTNHRSDLLAISSPVNGSLKFTCMSILPPVFFLLPSSNYRKNNMFNKAFDIHTGTTYIKGTRNRRLGQ